MYFVWSKHSAKLYAFLSPKYSAKLYAFLWPKHSAKLYAFLVTTHSAKLYAFWWPKHSAKLYAFLWLATLQNCGYGTDLEAYEQAIDNGHKACETLVTSNMGLVYFAVKDIMGRNQVSLKSLSCKDLVQEGAIGLAQAVDKNNPFIGTKFSTYAIYWIRTTILRCIAERDDIVHVPKHMSMAVHKVSTAAQWLRL